ncbi:cytochrome c family protein [Azospirillum brasilense]|uniref:Cytochrome c family protein n=3 Tax=Azospirillum TaxID=191 RepID=A0A235HHQ6_AZOBR|nr:MULTISPECIES: cytochrome c family protein [Azospirillum]ALJ37216.1 cytochrome C [Azospirillum brasilense]AWJ86201.1 cytochrome c family protein [Azospirillum sp. TSH58]KAA1054726.1 Cytochrome c2 [Azospirillum argentinense]MBK3798912.1 c-type cytochrome [Azospirillum argentinense]MDW7551930.1 cytochrome c family protein [Azospirillum brasilense]
MNKHILGAALIAGIAMGAGAAQAADAAAGKDVFKQCMACHTAEQGKNKVGPSLFGVVGRPAASIDGFKYSKPMQEKAAGGLVWTPDNLKAYITAPKEVVPGGTMAFAGIKDAGKVDDLIAFLGEQK